MNTLIRLLALSIYPLLIIACFSYIYLKNKKIIKKNIKAILFNTCVITILITIALIIFFKYENTIYNYDYAGHWIRSLTLRKTFYENPKDIFSTLYYSMNNYDYSYLPALFNLPLILINQSYGFFCLSNLILFLAPTYLLLNVLYFKYINKNRYFPLIFSILFYPLYLTIFYGKVDCCGLFFIIFAYSLIILPKFEDITFIDNLFVNLCSFIVIFERRWYLYSVLCLYVSYFIKWLFSKKSIKTFISILFSGIFALAVILVAFYPFVLNTLNNNFIEAYEIYNNEGKLLSFINYMSPIIVIVSIIGLIREFKTNKELFITNLFSIVIPCIMVWRIQSFEFHHYYIFLLNILILFSEGILYISLYKASTEKVLLVLLAIQPIFVFSSVGNTMPLYTNIRKTPEILYDKDELIDLSCYLKSIETDESQTAFLCGGRYGIITDDLLRNAVLPDLDMPQIDSAVLDLRDGFPKDFQYIRYIVVIEPMLYTNMEYQHIFDVISYAITREPTISKKYNQIHSTKIDDYVVVIYERVDEITNEDKEYFYNQMISYYPDKEEYFSYILEYY